MADHRSGTQPVTVLQALPLAIGDVQRLFGGLEGRRRWRRVALTAIMAGAVGVGVQPPPLGLLHPVWSDPVYRETVLTLLAPAWPLLALLGVVVLGFAVWARSFLLALVESFVTAASSRGPQQVSEKDASDGPHPQHLSRGESGVSEVDASHRPHPQPLSHWERGVSVTGAEKPVSFRSYLGAGAAHFVWSTCLSVPLYALLFAMEAATTQASWDRLLKATEAEIVPIVVQALLGFLALLVPWVVLTLPVMVFQYELVPVAMIRRRKGPLAAAREVLGVMRASPGRFAGYLVGRTLFQFIGAGLMTVAAIPCLIVSGVVSSPILGGGGMLASSLGGWNTAAGAAAGSATILLSCALFYCVTCAVLLPLTAVPFLLADRVLGFGASD